MFSSRNKGTRRVRRVNDSGVYDWISIVCGIVVILTAVVLFIDREKYEKGFTIVFLFSAVMNICMGIKYHKRSDLFRTITCFAAGIAIGVLAVISIPALWF